MEARSLGEIGAWTVRYSLDDYGGLYPMIWQDVLLMFGGFGFVVALIPAVRSQSKPPRSTCAMTGGILALFCLAYATLGLWLAFIATAITSTLWFVLLLQQVSLRR